MKCRRIKQAVLSLVILTILPFKEVTAANISDTWTGTGATNLWTDTNNWASGTAFPGGTGSSALSSFSATFNNVTPYSTVDASNISISKIVFDANPGAYTITGVSNPLYLTNGGSTGFASTFSGSNVTETINGSIVIAGSGQYTFSALASGTNHAVLNIGGNLTATGSTSLLLKGNNAETAWNLLSANISDSAVLPITITLSSGNWKITGNNSAMQGGVTMNSNTNLGIGSANALGTGTLTLARGNFDNFTGSVFTASNNMAWNNNNTLSFNSNGGSNNIMLSGTMIMAQGATFSIAQSSTVTLGTVTGQFKVTKQGSATVGLGTLIINQSQTSGQYTVNAGELVIENQLITLSGITSTTLQLTAAPANGGSFTVNGITFNLSGATLTNGQTWSIFGTNVSSANLGAGFSVSGFTNSSGIWSLVNGADSWTFNQATGILSLSVVPEPSIWTLMGVGLVLLSWVFYRHRRIDI